MIKSINSETFEENGECNFLLLMMAFGDLWQIFFYSRSCIGTNRFLDVKHMLSQIMRFFLMFNPFVYIVVLMMVAIRCKRTYCIMGDTNYIWEEQYNIFVSKLAKNLSVLTLYTLINMLGHNEYNKYSARSI